MMKKKALMKKVYVFAYILTLLAASTVLANVNGVWDEVAYSAPRPPAAESIGTAR